MIIPILSTLSCLGWVVCEWEWEEPTDGITQILHIICSRCVRHFVGFLMHFLLSCCDDCRRCKPLLQGTAADGAQQYVLQILFVPPTLLPTALRR